MLDDVEWDKENTKKNTPDEDFKIPWEVYEKNKWFALETWGMLLVQDVEHIHIEIEEPFKKPIGSIVWIISLIGNKSAIPVNLNQPHEAFKVAFKKAGGIIFTEINFIGTQREKIPKKETKATQQEMFYKPNRFQYE